MSITIQKKYKQEMATCLAKIKRKWMKLRLQPIRVFCLHHVCARFDPESMNRGDWMDIAVFRNKVLAMKRSGVRFISLREAYERVKSDKVRMKKYAVLTFDDGYASLKEVLPWLKEQYIPVTLFVNPDYAEGKAYRETDKESYLTIEELSAAGVEIGMHGTQHLDVSKMNEVEFHAFADESVEKTSQIKGYVPYWAYTWGRHNDMTDRILRDNKIVPVYMDGAKNYNDASCIHRELID